MNLDLMFRATKINQGLRMVQTVYHRSTVLDLWSLRTKLKDVGIDPKSHNHRSGSCLPRVVKWVICGTRGIGKLLL